MASDQTAFVDESVPRVDRDPGTYIMVAAILADQATPDAREQMRATKPKSLHKTHWHEQPDHSDRAALIEAVNALPVEHLIVVRTGDARARLERRRRLCLNRLCVELTTRQVNTVVLESRGRRDDRSDRDLLEGLRQNHRLDRPLRMDHKPGPVEPLLWIADIVCGAVTQDRAGNPFYLDLLKRPEVITLEAA